MALVASAGASKPAIPRKGHVRVSSAIPGNHPLIAGQPRCNAQFLAGPIYVGDGMASGGLMR